MEFPKVLSLEEQEQRYLFTRFITRAFSFGTETSTQFSGALTPGALFDIYKTYNPETTLLEDNIAHLLAFGGFINKQGRVYLKIREDMFATLPEQTQDCLISYCDFAKALKLRQIMTGARPEAVHRNIILDESFRHFIQSQIFNNRFKYWRTLGRTERRVSTKDLYEYYQSWCFRRNYIPNSKKALCGVLENLGYKLKNGYYRGVSGVRYVDNCVIPRTTEERRSTELYEDLGILVIGGKHVFNDGILLEDLSAEGLQAYLNGRRYKSSEQSYTAKKRNEEEIQTVTEDTDRSGDEVSEEAISQRETKISKGDKNRTNTDNSPEHGILPSVNPRTSDKSAEGEISEDGTNSSANTVTSGADLASTSGITSSADRDAFHSNLGLGADIQTISSSLNESDRASDRANEEVIAEVEPTITGAEKRAFFTGLRVTYRLSPGTFDFEFFKEEMTKANLLGVTEEYKRTLFDEFMKTIKR